MPSADAVEAITGADTLETCRDRGRDVRRDTDVELIRRMAARDGEAAAELFRRHHRAMLAVACRISRDRVLAEDATQDACLQAWRDADRYEVERGSVQSWLHTIVRGRTLDALRARQTRHEHVRPGLDPDASRAPGASVDAALERRLCLRAVDAALAVLPEQEGHAIKLAYYEGLTHTEIATRLDVPLGTAKTKLRRGMQVLRTAVDGRRGRPFDLVERRRSAPSSVVTLSGLHIFVVDDEQDTIKLTTLILQRAGASVTCAASAGEAIQRLGALWPDVALIDLGMPDADGYAVMAHVPALRQTRARALPAVAFTALASADDRAHTRTAGFALHLAKPIGPARLVDAIASVASRAVA